MITTILARPYAGAADLQAIVDLLNACEEADRVEMGTSVEELRTLLDDPRIDSARDLQLWVDGAALIGYGQIWVLVGETDINTRLTLAVLPELRGQGLEQQILEWAEVRVRDAVREHGKPARLRIPLREDQAAMRDFIAGQGFTIDRYSYLMGRALEQPIDEPQLPGGFSIREVAGAHEAEQWTELFNLSFIDHPNHTPWDAEQVRHYLEEPLYRQDLNLVAVAEDGTLVGFCWGMINPEQNARIGRLEGELDLVGTRRGYRKLGLARALLLTTLQRLKQLGMSFATLSVVANNPTGALRLYESVGFQREHTWVRYGKDISLRGAAESEHPV